MKTLPKSVLPLLYGGAVVIILSAFPVSGQEGLDEEVRELHQAGKYAEAIPLAQRALAIKEKALGPEYPGLTMRLNGLARLYAETGEYAKAEPLYQRSLAIYEKVLGPDHHNVAASLGDLGLLYSATGEYAKAEPLLQRSLAMWEKALGPEHPGVAGSRNNLANLYHATGQYAKAELLHQRSLAIREKALGPEHPDVAQSLHNLANLYHATGQYAKAELLLQRSLAMWEKALGPEHPDVATSLNNLGELYLNTGQYAKAEPLYQRSLAIKEKALGPAHPDVATRLNNLGELYLNTGQYAKAEILLQRSLAIREKALGPEHPAVADSLSMRALLYRNSGQYAKAESLYQRSLAIKEKAFGPAHPGVAMSLNNLALLYRNIGQYAKAEQLAQRSLAIYEKALGPEHPSVATALNNLAALAAAQQDYSKSNRLFTRGLRIEDRQIQDVFAFTSEDQRLQFIETIKWSHLGYLSLIHQHLSGVPEAVRDGFETVLRRKGVVFDAQSRLREAVQSGLSEKARREWDELSSIRSKLAQLVLNKPETLPAEQYRDKLAKLRQQIEQSEQRLAKESALVAKELRQRNITVAAIAKTLPKNAAMVEFGKIRDFDFGKGQWKPTWRYLAFILTASGEVSLLDLGDAAVLERQVQHVLRDIKVAMESRELQILKKPDPANPSRPSVQSLTTLYAQVWAPLEKAWGSADKVTISPDGLLNLVPFAALLDGQGRAVVERYRLAYVSSGRELVGTEGDSPKPANDLLLVANPAFDKKLAASGSQGIALRSRDFRGVFSPLPGTERESLEIPPLVTGQKQVLVGEWATEGAVKAARSPRIMHLATHGFFLTDEDLDLSQDTQGDFLERDLAMKPRTQAKHYENSLMRSGLAFAGANYAAQTTEGDDGILTSLEITGMDLSGTELVVLSACDTGVGEVKTGEGVFGLRRAFALAGAKNLMMSLWPVSDDVTATQMKAFYKNMQTMPPAEALRQAQLETIKELNARDGIASPALWAPFILQGGQALGQ